MKTLAFTTALLIAFTFNSVANDRNVKEVTKSLAVVYPMVEVLPGDFNTKDIETLKYHAFLSGPAMDFGTLHDVLNNKDIEALRNVHVGVTFPVMEWGSPDDVKDVLVSSKMDAVVYPPMVYGNPADINTVEINALIK